MYTAHHVQRFGTPISLAFCRVGQAEDVYASIKSTPSACQCRCLDTLSWLRLAERAFCMHSTNQAQPLPVGQTTAYAGYDPLVERHASNPPCRGLLRCRQVTAHGFAPIAERLTLLRQLDLHHVTMTSWAWWHFAKQPLCALSELHLTSCGPVLDDTGLAAIARLRMLRTLRLTRMWLTDAALQQLEASRHVVPCTWHDPVTVMSCNVLQSVLCTQMSPACHVTLMCVSKGSCMPLLDFQQLGHDSTEVESMCRCCCLSM